MATAVSQPVVDNILRGLGVAAAPLCEVLKPGGHALGPEVLACLGLGLGLGFGFGFGLGLGLGLG